MSKRSAEQALRDELEEAETAFEKAQNRAEARRLGVVAAVDAKNDADASRIAAQARVDRANRALEALVPLPIEEDTDGAK